MITGAEFEKVDGYTITLADEEIPFETFLVTREIRVTETERSQEHGLWPAPTFLGKMTIQVTGDILGDSSDDYNLHRLALGRAFYPSEVSKDRYIGTLKVTYPGIAERLTAKVSLESWPELPLEALSPQAGKYNIQLKSFDPRWYGETIKEAVSIPAGATFAGRTYPKTYPKSYGVTSFPAGSPILTNSGNAEASPVITLVGPGADISMIIEINSVQYVMTLDRTLFSGDTVVIDFASRTAVFNGTQNIYGEVSGSYWKLPPGDSIFTYVSSPGNTDANSRATVSWQNAYVY